MDDDPVEWHTTGYQMGQGRLPILTGGITPGLAVTDTVSPVIEGIDREAMIAVFLHDRLDIPQILGIPVTVEDGIGCRRVRQGEDSDLVPVRQRDTGNITALTI